MTINRFDGTEYAFLSNFYECPVRICFPETGECFTFSTSEHAFQAAKCPTRAREFSGLTPGQAKRLGRQVDMRDDWEDVKDDVMYEVVLAKFTQNEELKDKLLATGDEELVEGNTWGDRYWGQVNGVGKNMLGKTLMRVRDELRDGSAQGASDSDEPVSQAQMADEERARRLAYAGPAPSVQVPLVRAVDPDGNEIARGYYFRWVTRQPHPAGDSVKPEDVRECIIYSGFADWNMPKKIEYMVIEEPNRIELLDDEWFME